MIHDLIDLLGSAKLPLTDVERRLGATLRPGQSAREIADALIRAAGKAEIDQTRVW